MSAEWIAGQWTQYGDCWLSCPNCSAVTRFSHAELVALYDPQPTKANPNQRPFAKCDNCDFTPYLPLELKRTTKLDLVLSIKDEVSWSSVEAATTEVVAETYGAPKELGKWRNLKPDSAERSSSD